MINGSLYVSTQLETRQDAQPDFRVLDPEYYSWLRHKMNLAKIALHEDSEDWQLLRDRFNEIHNWAIENLDLDKLKQAVSRMTPARAANYHPPGSKPKQKRKAEKKSLIWSDHLHPSTGGKFTEKVSQTALERVQAIEVGVKSTVGAVHIREVKVT